MIMAAPRLHGSLKQTAEKPEIKSASEKAAPVPESDEPMGAERREIISWLKKVRFRRRFFGGVDEKNVWKKISELDALYTKALEAERVRYDVLIAEAVKKAGAQNDLQTGSGAASIPEDGIKTGGDPSG